MKIHHIGFLAKRINPSIEEFKSLGYSVEKEPAEDKARGAIIAFMQMDGYRVELIQPIDKESTLYPLLKKYRNSPYHFCYETGDFDKSIKDMEESGYHMIIPPAPAPCIEGRRVAFLSGAGTGMVEILEDRK